jgi:hypothetical protein
MVRTTLYDLIETLEAVIDPAEATLVAPIVVALADGDRVKWSRGQLSYGRWNRLGNKTSQVRANTLNTDPTREHGRH